MVWTDRMRTALMQRAMALYRKPASGLELKLRIAVICGVTWPTTWWALRDRDRRLILVHQPGKVASKAIVAALHDSPVARDYRVFQTHSLAPSSRDGNRIGQTQGPCAPSILWGRSELLSRNLGRRMEQERPLIVTVIRDPFDRHPSDFIHNLDRYIEGFRPFWDDPLAIDFDVLLYAYEHRFPHDARLSWYDNEIRDLFGVDVIRDSPAQDADGFALFDSQTATVALLRYEQLGTAFPAMTKVLFGLDLPLPRIHATADRGLAPLLESLRDAGAQLVTTQEVFKSSALYRRFYT